MKAKSLLPYSVNVFAPIGGFGNHIRWLLFLNSDFALTVQASQQSYENVSGPNWPSYAEYCSDTFIEDSFLLSDTLYNEHCKKIILNTTESKIEFIREKIYNNNRSWQNWLFYEWQYRDALNSAINMSHDIVTPEHNSKNIIAVTSPELSLRTYIKFNTNLNRDTIPLFVSKVEKFNHVAQTFKQDRQVLLIRSDTLYQAELPRTVYNSIVEFLEIDNSCYSQAKEIHKVWFNLHCSAERDIVNFFKTLYHEPFVPKMQL